MKAEAFREYKKAAKVNKYKYKYKYKCKYKYKKAAKVNILKFGPNKNPQLLIIQNLESLNLNSKNRFLVQGGTY